MRAWRERDDQTTRPGWRKAPLLVVSCFVGLGCWIYPAAAQETAMALIEWLPSYANSRVIQTLESAIEDVVPAQERRHIMLFASEEEQQRVAADFQTNSPDLIIAFGDALTERLAAACPDVAVLGVLCLQTHPGAGAEERPSAAASRAVIRVHPDPEVVWRLARRLLPDMGRLGILYSAGYAPNEQLAASLQEKGSTDGVGVVKAAVPLAYCVDEKAFVQALDEAMGEKKVDLFILPDDPNCSRFASGILQFTTAHGVPVIGSEATLGKGCVAATTVDYAEVGRRTAAFAAEMLEKRTFPTADAWVKPGISFDEEAMAHYGLVIPERIGE